MATETTLILLLLGGFAILVFYGYIASIYKVLQRVGLSSSEVGLIVLVTLFFGTISVPVFPYHGWWVGISIGGALIPLLICAYVIYTKRVSIPELLIGIVIVTFISYLVTRPEEGVGIVADLPVAFAPALAAGLFALSTFWIDIGRAAPLAYASGIIGTIVGADLLHLSEMLSFPAPAGETVILSIGGANIFDMVYLTGVVAVAVDIVVLWVKSQEAKHGMAAQVAEFYKGAQRQPYAKEVQPAPTLQPGRRGRI